MRSALATILVLILTNVAWAEPAADQAVVERSGSHARDLADTHRSNDLILDAPLTLELPYLLPYDDAIQSISLRLGEQPPESLVLEVDVSSACTIYLTADLDAELPRLDAMDGDTYFTAGISFHLTKQLCFYAEDFQPASMVIGGSEEVELEPVPMRSWDGHQVSIGSRLRLADDRVELQGASVFHVLSASNRESSVGAIGSVTFRF